MLTNIPGRVANIPAAVQEIFGHEAKFSGPLRASLAIVLGIEAKFSGHRLLSCSPEQLTGRTPGSQDQARSGQARAGTRQREVGNERGKERKSKGTDGRSEKQ